MTLKSLVPACFAVLSLAASGAVAQEADDTEAQLIEKVVVRNRLHTMEKRFELSPSVGFTIVTRLTEHYNFNIGAAYNFTNTLAAEIRGGYAYSRQTGLARQVGEHLLQRNPATEVTITDDLSNLWEMKANGIIGGRWAPLYGKINLMAELPVHFQTYLWAGAGAGTFHRESLVVCFGPVSSAQRQSGQCPERLTEDKTTFIVSGALGFRFFTHQHGGLRLEVRSMLFPDSFREQVNRKEAEDGNRSTGTEASNPGLTNLVLFDLGYTFLF
jgi:outer membrane beta-barrel protein